MHGHVQRDDYIRIRHIYLTIKIESELYFFSSVLRFLFGFFQKLKTAFAERSLAESRTGKPEQRISDDRWREPPGGVDLHQ